MSHLGRVVALVVAGVVAACGGGPEIIVATAAGVHLSDEVLDADPVALLPGGAVGVAFLDARQLFASPFGQDMLSFVQSRVPLPASAGFDPRRDLVSGHVGFYSMQGLDFVAALRGTFEPQALEAAAAATPTTPLGAPVVRQEYAGRVLFVARNVGFVALTRQTVLVGNETALRRALDRIAEARIGRAIPAWYEEMLGSQSAPAYGGLDLRTHPIVGANADQLPFMRGVRTARIVANFQDPGVHAAGTLTYADQAKAAEGAAQVVQFRDFMKSMRFFTFLLGFGDPVRSLEARAEGNDVKFVAAVEGGAVKKLLEQAATSAGFGGS